MNLADLIIGGLAVWRLSHALVKENGPLMAFVRLRARLATSQKRSGGLFDMISCVYCVSFWIGLIASVFTSRGFFSWIEYGLALSAVAFLLESLTTYLNSLAVVTPKTRDTKIRIGASPAPE